MALYEPAEDSLLLEGQVKKYAKGTVLDMGTGSGIQAKAAASLKGVKSVLAADIQKEVISHCRKTVKNRKIKFIQSNLFSKIKKKKFDTIIFNPPYLPAEPKLKDITVEGGAKGYETVERFLRNAGGHLKDGGEMLLLISSLTKQQKCEELMRKNLFDFEEISRKHIFFEDLIVYRIKKMNVLGLLKKKGIAKFEYFTKGHRGLLIKGKYKGKAVMIKSKLPESMAVGRIANEAKWIARLNKEGIGPKMIFSNDEYVVYEYVPGPFFEEFAEKSAKGKILKIIKDVLMQCHKMDIIGVDKEEMQNPYKHIIASRGKAVLVDFERARFSKNPKNVTQLMQYLASRRIAALLGKKGISIGRDKMITLAKAYKKSMDIRPVALSLAAHN
jgi:release factor glutamine methyltransferase